MVDSVAQRGLLFREAVNLFGTTDPWREEAIALLETMGVDPDRWYDPIFLPGVKKEDNLGTEVANASTNRYDAMIIGPRRFGRLSKIELGHTMVKAVCGGTEPHIRVSPLADDDEAAVRARQLVLTALDQMRTLLPADRVQIVDPLSSAAEQQRSLNAWLRKIGGRVVSSQTSGLEWVETTPPLLEAQPPGKRQVFLSGTSVASSPAKEAFKAEAARHGLPVVDSYTGATFTEADMVAEYEMLRASQVSAVMITNDTETIGGTTEAPIRAALAAMNLNRRAADGTPLAQAFGLFIEEPDAAKLTGHAFFLRQALLLHVKAIQRRFPSAIYLATSPEDLAAWAARQ